MPFDGLVAEAFAEYIRVQTLNARHDTHRKSVTSHTQIIKAESGISQRQLTEQFGVSLDKANYLLKALLDKGYIKAGNFSRAENKLKYASYE